MLAYQFRDKPFNLAEILSYYSTWNTSATPWDLCFSRYYSKFPDRDYQLPFYMVTRTSQAIIQRVIELCPAVKIEIVEMLDEDPTTEFVVRKRSEESAINYNDDYAGVRAEFLKYLKERCRIYHLKMEAPDTYIHMRTSIYPSLGILLRSGNWSSELYDSVRTDERASDSLERFVEHMVGGGRHRLCSQNLSVDDLMYILTPEVFSLAKSSGYDMGIPFTSFVYSIWNNPLYKKGKKDG